MTVSLPGVEGPQGPPGTVFRGAWASGTTYAKDDVVTSSGSSYLALQSNVGVTPGTDSSTWALLASGSVATAGVGTGSVLLAGTDIASAGANNVVSGKNTRGNWYGVKWHSGGQFTTAGDSQWGHGSMHRATSGTTQLEITPDGASPTANNNLWTIAANTAYYFRARVLARRTDADNEVGVWTIDAVVSREATGNARLVSGGTATLVGGDVAAQAYVPVLTVDATNNRLAPKATGATGASVRWLFMFDILVLNG